MIYAIYKGNPRLYKGKAITPNARKVAEYKYLMGAQDALALMQAETNSKEFYIAEEGGEFNGIKY